MEHWKFDWPLAARQLGKIEHRDYASTVVPFHFNFAQRESFNQIMRMLFLTVIMLYEGAKRGEHCPIDRLVYRIENGLPIYPHEVPLRLLIGKSRRWGISALIQFIILLRMNFVGNSRCMLMAHNEDSANQIGNYARDIWNRWPAEFRHLRQDDDLNAEGRLKLRNESRLNVFTAGSRVAKTNSRGWTFEVYHFSEYAHYESFAESQACAAVAPPHAWIIKESTGNGQSGPFYNDWKNALTIEEAERAWSEKDYETLSKWKGLPLKHEFKLFHSWLDDPGLDVQVMPWERELYEGKNLDEYERALLAKFPTKATPGKLKWRRITIDKDCQNDQLEPKAYFAQEWPADPPEMFQATGSKVFAEHAEWLRTCELIAATEAPLLTAHLDGVSSPDINPLGRSNLIIYKLPEPGRTYWIGLDPKCGAVNNQDEHAITVWDAHDGTSVEEVACFWERKLAADAVGHIATMLGEMYNDAFITPEAQGGGLAVNRTIVGDNRYRSNRFYERTTLDAVGQKATNYFRFGVFSTEQMKDHMVQNAHAFMRDKRAIVRTPKLIEQIRAFERVEKKYGAPEGVGPPEGLDDVILSMLLGWFGGVNQGRPSSRGPRAEEVERAAALIAESMDPAMGAMAMAIAAKIGTDLAKSKRMRNVRPPVDKSSKPKQN